MFRRLAAVIQIRVQAQEALGLQQEAKTEKPSKGFAGLGQGLRNMVQRDSDAASTDSPQLGKPSQAQISSSKSR